MTDRLADLTVLLLDCQTTGATPAQGHLLELAWLITSASSAADSDAAGLRRTVVALPSGAALLPRIQKITGIDSAALRDAPDGLAVWRRLRGDLDAAAAAEVAVAHWARLERSFLNALQGEVAPEDPLALDFVCTHAIAQRLLPDLPRRGLRAVAGYLGHMLGEDRRAGPHVLATAAIWRGLLERLERDHDVTTLGQLRAWLRDTRGATRGGRGYPLPRERRLALPELPGVYRFVAGADQVLYVGKATSLKHRVNSYFRKRRHDARGRIMELLSQARDVDVTVTASALEAALLETDEIKRLAPPYNRALRARAREVSFASLERRTAQRTPDAAHRWGPLPGPDVLTPWWGLADVLASSATAPSVAAARRALDVPGSVPIEPAAAAEGARRFAEAYGLTAGAGRRDLLRAGALIWLARREEDPEELSEEPDDPAEGGDEGAAPWAVTEPEQVVHLLASAACRAAHLLRRARWLLALSESVLRWSPPASAEPRQRRVVVSAGHVVAQAYRDDGAASATPCWSRSAAARRQCFDTATYDRLRVLTTELKRLVTAEVDVTLQLRPQRVLDRAALARRLRWL